ncbi:MULTISPECIES: Sec-independent protein translocase subunit TatA [unclassified Pseudofrankia]|uniref:Sec-independent protein translocase subunit TatA n=1 Tax=unclassified Pseudofrankia TaxID=2994372 RepID=UPI0008DA0EAF|nr:MULTISPECIES: Sec-independent protein translocase subunit TatA [unclassified Pseudofrankia]MDT3444282.1 Sec-independent protein translocase subunit TatA [Pseudofrankia sp. BMG5.37]OHV43375.1 primosome assembly protein PriA [Pseudofrankia sp. BMG5.36]
MPDLGAPELIIIAVVVLVLFGSKKLPEAARSLGRSMRIFKSEVKAMGDEGGAPAAPAEAAPAAAIAAPAAPTPADNTVPAATAATAHPAEATVAAVVTDRAGSAS